jgi:ubiquitin C-terminal hydrolase
MQILSVADGLICPYTAGWGDVAHPRRLVSYRRILNTPEILTLQIKRRSGVTLSFGGVEFHRTAVTAPDKLDISAWAQDLEHLSDNQTQGHAKPASHSNYRLYARVHYLPGATPMSGHWVSYIRLGDQNNGPWVLFDDLTKFQR